MNSEQFRARLRKEAAIWQAEGIISPEQHQQLADRYQFSALDNVAHDRFVMILIGTGSILLGLAAITLVAANWQFWGRSVKSGLLFSLFLSASAGGFYLWRGASPLPQKPLQKLQIWRQRLGHGLLLVGALLIGANMALMAQMFHIGGSGYELFVTWGLAVLIMATSLRLSSLGVLGLLLMGAGYLLGLAEIQTEPFRTPTWSVVFIQLMPVLAGPLFVPLAYWCRSRVIFGCAIVLTLMALATTVLVHAELLWSTYPALLAVSLLGLPPALLWGYDDLIFPALTARPFQPIARTLGLVYLAVPPYLLSFLAPWQWETPIAQAPTGSGSWWLWFNLGLLALWTGWEWLYLVKRHLGQGRSTKLRSMQGVTSPVVACLILCISTISAFHLAVFPIPELATFLFNIILFILASILLREGLEQTQRSLFWVGVILLTLQITSRMFEYDTDLLLKSLVFFLCGVGVIAAGVWFERHLSHQTAAASTPLSDSRPS